jgi:hypothetical protein
MEGGRRFCDDLFARGQRGIIELLPRQNDVSTKTEAYNVSGHQKDDEKPSSARRRLFGRRNKIHHSLLLGNAFRLIYEGSAGVERTILVPCSISSKLVQEGIASMTNVIQAESPMRSDRRLADKQQ